MKTLLRTLLYLSLVVWLGAEIFFPIVAAITFQTLQPDTHKAGAIVGELLHILHGATVYAQFGIVPAMERDRAAAGGAINTFDPTNPLTVDFNKLHNRSVDVEGLVSLLGLATVVLVARAESTRS